MSSPRIAVAVGLLLLNCTGCAGTVSPRHQVPAGDGSAQTTAPDEPYYQYPVDQARDYEDLGIVSERLIWPGVIVDPPVGVTPEVSIDVALRACFSLTCGEPTRTAEVSFGVGTATGSGTAGPDGELIPAFVGEPLYQFVWTGIPCVSSGPPRSEPKPIESCTAVTFVSAQDGAPLLAESGPGLGPHS